MLKGINHITLAVKNVDLSFQFYTSTLGFKPHAKWEKGAYLTLNSLWLCLSLDESCPSQDYSHIALDISREDFPLMKSNLETYGVRLWKSNTSEGDSLYFLDPDGHKLELHVGSLHSRMQALKQAPYKGMIFY